MDIIRFTRPSSYRPFQRCARSTSTILAKQWQIYFFLILYSLIVALLPRNTIPSIRCQLLFCTYFLTRTNGDKICRLMSIIVFHPVRHKNCSKSRFSKFMASFANSLPCLVFIISFNFSSFHKSASLLSIRHFDILRASYFHGASFPGCGLKSILLPGNTSLEQSPIAPMASNRSSHFSLFLQEVPVLPIWFLNGILVIIGSIASTLPGVFNRN